MSYSREIIRNGLLSICFVALYRLLTAPHAIIIYHVGTVAWYPVTGLVIGLLLGVSPYYAPLIAFCALWVNATTYGESLHSFGQTFGTVGFVTGYTAAAYILRGPWGIDLGLHHRRDVVRYLLVACGAVTINTFIGSACLVADGSVEWHDFWPAAYGWFLGDSIGVVGIAPFLLVHVLPPLRNWLLHRDRPLRKNPEQYKITFRPYAISEACGQLLSIVFVVWLMFGMEWGRYHTFFLGVVPIVWIAMRQGIRRVVIGTLIFNFSIVLAMDVAPPPIDLLTKISLLMLVVSGVGLIVGSEVSERNRVAADLQERTTYLNALIENSPLGIVVFNQKGRAEFANPAFERLLLYKQRDLALGDIAILWLEGVANALPSALSGKTCHLTVKQKRKDGKTLDLALHAVPLQVDGQVRGVYTIYEDISERVKAAEAEKRYAESQRQLVEELQLRAQQMMLLNDMGSRLHRCETLQEASAIIEQFARRLFPDALSGRLYVPMLLPKTLETAMQFGEEGLSQSDFPLDACASLRRAQPNWHDLRDPQVTCYHLRPDPSRQHLCVPISGQDETLGVFHLEFRAAEQAPGQARAANLKENWQSLAVTIAGQLALSLAAIRLREDLRDQAIRDPLTNLYNRRFMEESLSRELERAARGHYPVSLLFLDLDHFKRFNDTFGHAAGDVVVRSLAVLLRSFFRSSDVCCRAGGEEFAVILPEAAPESAIVRANALRLEVKALQLAHEDKALGSVTVSIGIAAFPDHASTPQQLLQVADSCLYKSKAQGRDMATLAGTSKPQPMNDPAQSRVGS